MCGWFHFPVAGIVDKSIDIFAWFTVGAMKISERVSERVGGEMEGKIYGVKDAVPTAGLELGVKLQKSFHAEWS